MVLATICVPTYNGASYLSSLFDSILSQTFPYFEVVVVDDCSTDSTVAIARRYAEQDNRIRLFVNPKNIGLVGNWNRCLQLAKGQWIKFLFQDDLAEPACLESMIATAKNRQVSFVVSARKFLFDSDIDDAVQARWLKRPTLGTLFKNAEVIERGPFARALLENRDTNFIGEPSSVMLNRNVIDAFGFFNEDLIQLCDFEYWARIGCNMNFAYIREQLVTFRVHSRSATEANRSQRYFRAEFIDPLIILHEFAYGPMWCLTENI